MSSKNSSKAGYDQFFKQAKKASSSGVRPNKNQSLINNINKGMLVKKKKKSAFNFKMIAISFFGLIIAAAGFVYHDEIEKISDKIEIDLFGTAIAQDKPQEKKSEATQAASSPNQEQASKQNTDEKNQGSESSASQPTSPKDENDHFAYLNQKNKELELKEEELKRVEAELAKQKEELDLKLKELQTTRDNISNVLQERVDADEKKVDTLVQLYTNMKPQSAAKVFETMDEDLAIQILGKMKKKNAADIMNLLKAEKAQILTEKFAGFKKDAEVKDTSSERKPSNND